MGCLAVLVLGLLVLLLPLALRAWIDGRYRGRIYAQAPDVPPAPAAIVFGAGYWPSGRLSDALADRMETAIGLCQAGKVGKLLLTGDNRFIDYNEPAQRQLPTPRLEGCRATTWCSTMPAGGPTTVVTGQL